MRITIVLSSLRGGGSIYAALNWANAWQQAGHQVRLVTIYPQEGVGNDFYVDPAIVVDEVDITEFPVSSQWGALKNLACRMLRLRKAITRTNPDVVIAFDGPVNVRTLLASMGNSVPVIVFEQVHPSQYSLGNFWGKWRKRLYPGAAAVLNLTESGTAWSEKEFRPKLARTIPNPVLPTESADMGMGRNEKRIVSAGRLVEQKRFDLLLDAFALIADRFVDWNLIIYGEGEDRQDLEERVDRLGLRHRVEMPGWTDNLSERMAECELFVLSSGYEGFGNVVAEAMVVGLPVVSFDCVAGPSDIIRDGVDGLLVPHLDVPALAEAMSKVMEDDSLRASLASRTPEVLERFSLEKTMKLWDDLFIEIGLSDGPSNGK